MYTHSQALLVLSLYFDTEPCALFLGAMLQPSQFRSLAKLLRSRGPDRVDFTFIRIDHSTIDSFVMISICRIPSQTIPPGALSRLPRKVLNSDAMPWSRQNVVRARWPSTVQHIFSQCYPKRNLLLSSLLGGVATQLLLGLGLHGALGSADGGGTGDGGFTEVGAVSGLGGGGGNVLEGPV